MKKKLDYDWNSIINDYIKSGLTPHTYAKQKGIPASTAYNRLKDIKKDIQAQDDTFIPLTVITSGENQIASENKIEITCGDISIKIYDGVNKQLLADILWAVKTVC